MCVCVYMKICAHMCRCQWKSEEDARSLGVGVKGSCKPPDVNAVK